MLYKKLNYVLPILILLLNSQLVSQDGLLAKYFDREGDNPYISDSNLTFSALKSEYLSPNGHGWRNELKKKDILREDMYNTVESISANIRFKLSPGAKTVFIQYHENNTSTLLLVYIADIMDKQLLNGIARDGIFDVYLIASEENGNKKKVPLGIAKVDELFSFRLENNNGKITVQYNNTAFNFKVKNSSKVYLKFGDYLQAQDPYTGKQAKQNDFKKFYAMNGIIEDEIVFENTIYKVNKN